MDLLEDIRRFGGRLVFPLKGTSRPSVAAKAARLGVGEEVFLLVYFDRPGNWLYQRMLQADVICFLGAWIHTKPLPGHHPGRTAPLEVNGRLQSEALGGMILAYWGDRVGEFIVAFRRYGWIIETKDVYHPSRSLVCRSRMRSDKE